MKVACLVNEKPAVIVGYCPGRKGRPMAIVITQGVLKAVRLKDIALEGFEKDLPNNVEPMPARKA